MKSLRFVTCCIIWAPLSGCTSVGARSDQVQQRFESSRVNSAQFRMLTYELATACADQVSATADQIKAQAGSPEVRRNALLWKINFIPLCFQAASRPHAILAFADVWVLCKQNLAYLETGAGKTCFGPQQAIAIAAARAMELRAQSASRALVGSASGEEAWKRGVANVEEFARKYPVESIEFQREPILLHRSDLVPAGSATLVDVASDMQEDFGILQLTINSQAAYLPKIARWQAELLLYDADRAPLVDDTVGLAKQIPGIVERERQSILTDLHKERVDTLDVLERMRASTVESVSKERVALAALIVDERTAVLKQVANERGGGPPRGA